MKFADPTRKPPTAAERAEGKKSLKKLTARMPKFEGDPVSPGNPNGPGPRTKKPIDPNSTDDVQSESIGGPKAIFPDETNQISADPRIKNLLELMRGGQIGRHQFNWRMGNVTGERRKQRMLESMPMDDGGVEGGFRGWDGGVYREPPVMIEEFKNVADLMRSRGGKKPTLEDPTAGMPEYTPEQKARMRGGIPGGGYGSPGWIGGPDPERPSWVPEDGYYVGSGGIQAGGWFDSKGNRLQDPNFKGWDKIRKNS